MPTVKLATLNLFNRMGQWGMRAPLVIGQLEVDLVLDQGMWVARQINKRMAEQPHYRIKHATNPDTRASFHSIATMSRIGFEEHEVLDLMTFERVAQRFVFKCGDR